MKIVLPPPEVQRELVAGLDRRMSLLDAAQRSIERQLNRCEQLRQSILNAALSGRLVPQDPADEPATALLDRIQAERPSEPGDAHRRTRRKKEPTS